MPRYRIGLSRDLLDASGKPIFAPVALSVLEDDPLLEWEWFGDGAAPVSADDIAKYDGICLGAPALRAQCLERADRRTRIVARFGVGFDHCDIPALTRSGILLTINPLGVRRSVATSIIAFILSLAHRLPALDRLVRRNAWHERMLSLGTGLAGRTLGLIGVGNIGKEVFRLARPFEMRHIAYDPMVRAVDVEPLGVSLAEFDTVVASSDFLAVCCPLSEATRGLISERVFELMKPSAFLINTARGPIVDERALIHALSSRRIAGAALDVFEQEPTPADNPLLKLDNVILTPHAVSSTDEALRLMAEGAFGSARAFFNRQVPSQVVNTDLLATAAMKDWLKAEARASS